MSTNLIPIKSYLGKYYPELHYSAIQEKYAGSGIDTFFDQRFHIQNNKVQMIVDPSLPGLSAIISGNEIQISKELYDHPNVTVTNSLENKEQMSNPRSLYNADTFSTLAYLVCQNHTMLQITGELDEPIYLKYRTEFESFYNSVIIVEVMVGIEVEIVEEIESSSALNSLTNYILQTEAKMNLFTFYNNNKSAISFTYRNIITRPAASFKHYLLGKGSSNVIDENKIMAAIGSKSEFLGIVDSNGQKFHSILSVVPENPYYSVIVDYRDILFGKADVTFFPVIIGQQTAEGSEISVSNIDITAIPAADVESTIASYTKEIMDRFILSGTLGVKRFYDNKAKFL